MAWNISIKSEILCTMEQAVISSLCPPPRWEHMIHLTLLANSLYKGCRREHLCCQYILRAAAASHPAWYFSWRRRNLCVQTSQEKYSRRRLVLYL